MFHNVSSSEERQEKDLTKSEFCKEKGITLIEIPYWWDRQFESLYATVYNKRPDLFSTLPTEKPIPLTPPTPRSKLRNKSKKTMCLY